LLAQPYRKSKGAAVTGDALHADLPPHLVHQLFANGKAQTRAAELPRGRRICLGKRLEQHRLDLGGHADARVGHGKFDERAVSRFFAPSDMHHHLALLGKFECIADEIDEDLTHAAGVAS
jgi:hypothetical protein